ncbi:MAG: hypothetical protein JEY99_18505 [Spirochaetales bacterium]|nr:hypothetical protein [Spirochaetales bacterium]
MLDKKILLLFLLIMTVLLGSCDEGLQIPEGTGMVSLNVIGTVPAGSTSQSVRSINALSRAVGDPVAIPVFGIAGTEIGTLTLTEVLIALEEIELKMEDAEVDTAEEEEQEIEIEFEGPYIIDLVSEISTPAMADVYLLPGIYDEIELKIAKMEGDEMGEDGITPMVSETDPLYENSIYITGSYTGETSGGDVVDTPFTFILDLDEEFELTGAGDTSLGYEIVEGQALPLLIAFRLVRWFDFSNTETNEDGVLDFSDVVVVSDEILLDTDQGEVNEAIREIIKENIKESADYGEDEDEDGELASEEDDDPDEEDEDDD